MSAEGATLAENEMTDRQDRQAPTASVRTGSGYRTDVRIRDHAFLTDEPVDKGGTDTGPTPSELLAGALAACTSITIRMYADRKQWPVGDIDVRVWRRRVDEKDPADPSAAPRRIDVFEMEVDIDGPLTEEQLGRLMDIAGRCPVKRAMDGNNRIVMRRG